MADSGWIDYGILPKPTSTTDPANVVTFLNAIPEIADNFNVFEYNASPCTNSVYMVLKTDTEDEDGYPWTGMRWYNGSSNDYYPILYFENVQSSVAVGIQANVRCQWNYADGSARCRVKTRTIDDTVVVWFYKNDDTNIYQCFSVTKDTAGNMFVYIAGVGTNKAYDFLTVDSVGNPIQSAEYATTNTNPNVEFKLGGISFGDTVNDSNVYVSPLYSHGEATGLCLLNRNTSRPSPGSDCMIGTHKYLYLCNDFAIDCGLV